ncbi:hypothetical protein ATANTOWER_029837 [Ataeniobius toweri]|uniref:Uncharacterized protein n=1 Tax=Ataeniobius toweri TaxID=208326 RepID=A0ABU7C5X1_9TELE|nr:hypothetical protein [Ataeniobius toweri]
MWNEGSERCPENDLWSACLQRRCNPVGSDGCDAGRTGSAVKRKPVVEVVIQSPQEAWNGKGESTNDHHSLGWYEETLEEGRHKNEGLWRDNTKGSGESSGLAQR